MIKQDRTIDSQGEWWPVGTRLVFAHPTYGYQFDQEQARDAGLVVGSLYTVSDSAGFSSSSIVELAERPGRVFNTVLFTKSTAQEQEKP